MRCLSKKKTNLQENNSKNKNDKKKKGWNITIYLTLRLLVIISMLNQGYNGNWNNVFLCILTLILFTLPSLVSKKFHIELPTGLEISTYLFIFASEILGEIQNFYGIFTYWDTMLHTLNGFLCGAIGFSLVDILNNNENLHIHLTPVFVAMTSICFSMTIGIFWEFIEYAADTYLGKDMQKDRIVQKIQSVKINPEGKNEVVSIEDINKTIIYYHQMEDTIIIEEGYLEIGLIDTMKDLFVNFIGAFVFSLIGYFYIKNREGYHFAEKFIPRLKR